MEVTREGGVEREEIETKEIVSFTSSSLQMIAVQF